MKVSYLTDILFRKNPNVTFGAVALKKNSPNRVL
jgi:hypothetical protein